MCTNCTNLSCATPPPCRPADRRLGVFSLDPAADVQLDTAAVSRSVISVPWEDLSPGPVGEYVEVVDVDPPSGCVYDPVDLDHHFLLGQDGHAPSIGNPQFHQQMAYAVAMKTIKNFEQVIGREVLWSERSKDENGNYLDNPEDRFVQRLRIYPHAIRDENAYYSPAKKALLFGYYNAPATDPRDELPGGNVFTCLSHDIIAHETVHAILDGIHPRLLKPTNEDMLAFHEAFADIVAIFQHFTLPGLLLDQVQRTRGYLAQDNLLARLAVQFARSTNRGNALRNALGTLGPDGRRISPNPVTLSSTQEPHERGAILVAAVFDAFLRMYEHRIQDLRRIATGGTGKLPDGDIHPDLARRFAHEAASAAQRVLNMCIRAIDYIPPVDVTFGDYLRALVTADADFFPSDPRRYRLAFIEAFRERGILPLDVRSLAEDSLRWDMLSDPQWESLRHMLPPTAVLRTMASAYDAPQALVEAVGGVRQELGMSADLYERFRKFEFTHAAEFLLERAWQPQDGQSEDCSKRRFHRYLMERLFAKFLHGWITFKAFELQTKDPDLAFLKTVSYHLGLNLEILAHEKNVTRPAVRFEVHAVRPTIRLRPNGCSKVELLIMLTQRVRRLLNEPEKKAGENHGELSFKFRGGCTLIIDPESGRIRYAISKSLKSQARLGRTAKFFRGQIAREGGAAVARFRLTQYAEDMYRFVEPFAMAHSSELVAEGY